MQLCESNHTSDGECVQAQQHRMRTPQIQEHENNHSLVVAIVIHGLAIQFGSAMSSSLNEQQSICVQLQPDVRFLGSSLGTLPRHVSIKSVNQLVQ